MQLSVGAVTSPLYRYSLIITVLCPIIAQLPKVRSFHIASPTHLRPPTTTTGCLCALPPGAWRQAEIDYSAANGYVEAHYGEHAPSKPYFLRTTTAVASPGTGRVVEPIYDARNGVYDPLDQSRRSASLPSCGFAMRWMPSGVTDWSDVGQIRGVYVEELAAMASSVFPERRLRHDVVFWNPMLRGEDCAITRDDGVMGGDGTTVRMPTSNVASMVHIDTDVGAYESIDDLVATIDNNRIRPPHPADDTFRPADVVDSISAGHRFAVVNFWRNVGPTPVQRAPLALLDTRYPPPAASPRGAFPYAAPDPVRSRWYAFPNATEDECLLFLQYDRSSGAPSDVWHCALPSEPSVGGVPRRSFDVRALFVFEEKVPKRFDRFGRDRRRPVLDLEESGCFCDGQAEKRRLDGGVLKSEQTAR